MSIEAMKQSLEASKLCKLCKHEKPTLMFSLKANEKDGLQPYCKPCDSSYKARWNLANKERKAERNAAYRLEKREQILASKAEYRTLSKEKISLQQKAWAKKNKTTINANAAKRRAALLNRTPLWADKSYIADFYRAAEILSRGGVQFHVDHIIPLQGKLVSGFHVENNLQILPAHINTSKGNKYEQSI
jgi:hypothetical protein